MTIRGNAGRPIYMLLIRVSRISAILFMRQLHLHSYENHRPSYALVDEIVGYGEDHAETAWCWGVIGLPIGQIYASKIESFAQVSVRCPGISGKSVGF